MNPLSGTTVHSCILITMFRTLSFFSMLLGASAIVSAQDDPPPPPNFSKDIAPVVQAKCMQCHRPGDIAPFSIRGYDDMVTWADDIQRVLSEKSMPPWKPVPDFGEFRDSYQLTADERTMILA